jgi:hypothetical protein
METPMNSQKKPHFQKKILDCMSDNSSSMKMILQKVSWLKRLQNIFKEYLPAVIAENCVISGLNGAELKVATHSAAVSSQLRFLSQQLILELKKHNEFRRLKKIILSIDPQLEVIKKQYES